MEQLKKIVKDCKAGKRDAQAKLFKLFSEKMFGVCLYYCKDYTAAEDILQDGFIKVFKSIKQFESKGSFEGWIRRIMVNTALERYRKQHMLYAVNEIEYYTESLSYDDIIDSISAKDLLGFIQDLSPKYRMVFSLYAIEGYSHQEIGKKLGISEGTSKSNLSRARKILQNKVKENYGNINTKSRFAT